MMTRVLLVALVVLSVVAVSTADMALSETTFTPARTTPVSTILNVMMSTSPAAPVVGDAVTLAFTMTVSSDGGVTSVPVLGSAIVNDEDRKLQIIT